jgi:hypothetical protein
MRRSRRSWGHTLLSSKSTRERLLDPEVSICVRAEWYAQTDNSSVGGTNRTPRPLDVGFDYVMIIQFPDRETADKYDTHPKHDEYKVGLQPLVYHAIANRFLAICWLFSTNRIHVRI